MSKEATHAYSRGHARALDFHEGHKVVVVVGRAYSLPQSNQTIWSSHSRVFQGVALLCVSWRMDSVNTPTLLGIGHGQNLVWAVWNRAACHILNSNTCLGVSAMMQVVGPLNMDRNPYVCWLWLGWLDQEHWGHNKNNNNYCHHAAQSFHHTCSWFSLTLGRIQLGRGCQHL